MIKPDDVYGKAPHVFTEEELKERERIELLLARHDALFDSLYKPPIYGCVIKPQQYYGSTISTKYIPLEGGGFYIGEEAKSGCPSTNMLSLWQRIKMWWNK